MVYNGCEKNRYSKLTSDGVLTLIEVLVELIQGLGRRLRLEQGCSRLERRQGWQGAVMAKCPCNQGWQEGTNLSQLKK